ncbi:MAG: nitroreductase family protein [Candidatus Hydrogenedentes bacterium]|nr:nitroreductase family protein [Candidatus Hydrogenedentota bacterium]
MTFDEIVCARRSVRDYDPGRPVSEEDIRALFEAARLAPSACNSQTWRFIAVTGRERIEALCDHAMRPVVRNKWLRDAPLIIAGCSQLDIVANRVGAAVTGIEYYQIDLGIAMEHIVLKATELGLGTCWIGWFNEDETRRILAIPRRVRVSALLAVGYPREPLPDARPRKSLDAICFADTWGRPFAPAPPDGP